MQTFSCSMIMNQYLNFNGRIDTDEKTMTLCCEALPGGRHVPGVALSDDPEKTMEEFLGMRSMLMAGALKEGDSAKTIRRDSWIACKHCANYSKGDWQPQLMVTYVNLSMYPAPCQCRCIYCDVAKRWEGTEVVRNAYEKMFAVLELADARGVIHPNARWQVSSGEITIHPYKDRIMKLVGNRPATFYTNGFLFDEAIAANLESNEGSAINLSIDAGTAETWARVKGVDNFETVCMNLVEYYNRSRRAGQVTLKYIVMPGINDGEEDYASVMDIMEVLEVGHLTLACDTHKKYSQTSREHKELIRAAARLLKQCRERGYSTDMFTYAPAEREEVTRAAMALGS